MPERLELVATEDRSDRAHDCRASEEIRDERGVVVPANYLLPARMVRGGRARPREYPRAVMIEPVVFDVATGRPRRRRDGGGVVRRVLGEDSMHDSLYETQRRLEREMGGVDGLSARDCTVSVADARNTVLQGRSEGGCYATAARSMLNRNRAAYQVESAEVTLARYRNGRWSPEGCH